MTAAKPLTPKMVGALVALARLDASRSVAYSPNEIGRAMGQPKGRSTRSGSSPTHARVPSEGSGIASVLRGLEARGLIRWTTRRDGLTGVAYAITTAGSAEADRLRAEWLAAETAALEEGNRYDERGEFLGPK